MTERAINGPGQHPAGRAKLFAGGKRTGKLGVFGVMRPEYGSEAASDRDRLSALRKDAIEPQPPIQQPLRLRGSSLTPPAPPPASPAITQAAPSPVETGRSLLKYVGQPALPAVVPAEPALAGPQSGLRVINFDVSEIRGAMDHRRRVKAWALAARLGFFVFLPTALSWHWFTNHASPVFATYSEFTIQSHEKSGPNPAGMTGMAGALSGGQDAISLQGFIRSREAFNALDQRFDLRGHLTAPGLDAWHRLPVSASDEEVFTAWQRMIDVGFDPTEGVIRMRQAAFDPVFSHDLTQEIIKMSEDRIDALSLRMREDSMESLTASMQLQMQAVTDAQVRLTQVQARHSSLSGEMEGRILQDQLGQLESALSEQRLSLASLMANARPSAARSDPVKARISYLEDEIASMRSRIGGATGVVSIAAARAEIMAAETDLESRMEVLKGTLSNMELARAEALRQVRYLTVSVNPVVPDSPEFPEPFLNTLVVFLSLMGIYLLLSLSISLIREQLIE